MTFKKIALAAAIAAVPAVGFSVESLEDGDLGGVTGQDGIEVSIAIGAAGITTDVYLHDKDGLDDTSVSPAATMFTSYSFAGALVIEGMNIGVGGATIGLEIDAGDHDANGSAPVLNIGVNLPGTLTINTGNISVANSQTDNAGRGITSQSGVILNSMEIELGSTQLNIQLGNEVQTGSLTGTDMIAMSATINNGIVINSFALNDASVSGGAIGATSVTMKNSADNNLSVAADVNVTTAGLVIGLGQLGTAGAGNGMNIEIVDQYLGTTTAGIVGDVSIRNLQMAGTVVTISGK